MYKRDMKRTVNILSGSLMLPDYNPEFFSLGYDQIALVISQIAASMFIYKHLCVQESKKRSWY